MKLRYVILATLMAQVTIFACSMGKRSVEKRPLFKSLFYMGDSTGEVYKNECPKRARSGACKVKLVKKKVNFCEEQNFKEFKEERYILIKESDFLM